MYGKGGKDLGRTATGVHCEVERWGPRKEEGGHLLREDGCKSRRCEGLLNGNVKRGLGWRKEHTVVLVLDNVVGVGEWLVLRRKWIGGMKELIDSILHDWSVHRDGSSLT